MTEDNSEMDMETLTRAKLHILPMSVVDYKAISGRSLDDVTFELLYAQGGIKEGINQWEETETEALDVTLSNLYRDMQQRGVDDAICLHVNMSYTRCGSKDTNHWRATAYALGIRKKGAD